MEIVLTGEQTHRMRYVADNCYYIIPQQDRCVLCSTFHEAIDHIPLQNRILDPVALLSLLCFGYVCGDRTLVRGLKRLPLHSIINSKGEILRERQLPHGCEHAPIGEIAHKLQGLLIDEIDNVVRNESEVVILLSGGLDSRVTAGVLRRLQGRYKFSVKAVTWGSMQSRDWAFADRICEIYNWEHINIPIGPDTLWVNIKRSVDYVGAEVNGSHFHGIKELDKYLPKDVVILASTYGDGIGQAVYSGVRVEDLYFPKPDNLDGLFYQAWFRRSRDDLMEDIRAPWFRGDVCTQQQAHEIACQENYLRRMLNPMMRCSDDDFRLYQTFTSEAVVRYMWSLDPSLRDDRTYQALIPMLDYELARIPWQKTNQPLVENGWTHSTDCTREFHNYSNWIHTELRGRLEPFLLGDSLRGLSYINHDHVRFDWAQFQKMNAQNPFIWRVSQRLIHLVGVAMLMADYQITCDSAPFSVTLYDHTDLLIKAVWQVRKLKHHLKSMPYVGEYVSRKARKLRSAEVI